MAGAPAEQGLACGDQACHEGRLASRARQAGQAGQAAGPRHWRRPEGHVSGVANGQDAVPSASGHGARPDRRVTALARSLQAGLGDLSDLGEITLVFAIND